MLKFKKIVIKKIENKKNYKNFFNILTLILIITLIPACLKQSERTKDQKEQEFDFKPYEKSLLKEERVLEKKSQSSEILPTQSKIPSKIEEKKVTQIFNTNKNELDFTVKNITGKTVYVTCFSYIQKRPFTRWRWDKTTVYKLEDDQTTLIDIDTIPDKENRENVFGYLGVFDTEEEAENATYELTDESKLIDLDLLFKLKNKIVNLGVEKYGFQGKLLDYNFEDKLDTTKKPPELDFIVENQTGKTIYATCFVYQIKEDMPVWRYDKTDVIKIANNDEAVIDVDTITQSYNRVYVRGFLAIFDEDEKEKAEEATFELLDAKNKVPLDRLAALKNKKIVLEIEKYGTSGIIDFSVKPVQRIDFAKALKLPNIK